VAPFLSHPVGWAGYYLKREHLRVIEAGIFTNGILFLTLKALKGVRISDRSQEKSPTTGLSSLIEHSTDF